ncbi:MAG: FAD-dependent oxidoreductase [Pseudomonadota bacterium]
MKSQVRVAVIGGGVVGCSVLYHLAKFGWTDIALFERDELTSGSTWHAAGGCHTLNGDPNVAKLQKYTIELYKEIEELSGQATGHHITGGVMLADTEDRLEWMKMAVARGRYLGLESEVISVSEAKERFPLMDESQFVGAYWDPLDGHLDPSGVTHAYAKAAKKLGAEVHTHTKVEDVTQALDGTWTIHTAKGNVQAEHVVNAGGLWARECGRMVGLELPILAMEHMYLLTEDMPEVAEINEKTGKEVVHAIDFGGEIYMRQERGGMLMGTYEKACVPWSEKQTPWDFGHELLQPDIDRIAPSLEVGFQHFPAFQNAGIKQIINGPFTFAPDGNPLVGPVRGLANYWVACGVMAGFSQGGGVGLTLSQWMINGDPGTDVWGMDVARFGDWTTPAYTNAKVRENYSRRFSIKFPNEELPASRPLKTTPVYDALMAKGAVMGAAYGLETPLWYAPTPEQAVERFSFHRSTDFEHVAEECRAVRETFGLMETSSFAKYEVTGAEAREWLDHVLAGRIPEPGRMSLAPMLNEQGKVIGDFSVSCFLDPDGAETFMLLGSGVAEEYHMRWFEQRLLNEDGEPVDPDGAAVTPWGMGLVGLSIAGPKAQTVLAEVAQGGMDDDVSTGAFKFMDVREMDLGPIPARVGRVSFTGDQGYEIWVGPEYQRALFHALWEAGQPHGMKLFGARALNSLRLEKNFGTWAREYRPIYGPYECGLGRFVSLKKEADFVGRRAAEAEKADGGALRLRAFRVESDRLNADVLGDEAIWFDGSVKGWVTSGGYAHASKTSIALGYVPKEIADADAPWEIEILGERVPAHLQSQPIFDPNGGRMRA